MKDRWWLKVILNGQEIEAGVSEACMGSPRLFDIIEQAFWHVGRSSDWIWRKPYDFEVFDLMGNHLVDVRMHRQNKLKAGDTIIINRPIGWNS